MGMPISEACFADHPSVGGDVHMERTMTTVPSDRDVITVPDAPVAGRSRIRWGAVFAGMVIAVALLMLLVSLWLALAYGSDRQFVLDNMEWFIGGSAAACLLIGGFVAGRLSGVPGFGAGLAHGLTLWALALLISLSVGIPSLINVLNLGRVATELNASTGVIAAGVDTSLWATFLSISGALVAAALGGILGGISLGGARTVPDTSGFSRSGA
jgi:hypothetical protein